MAKKAEKETPSTPVKREIEHIAGVKPDDGKVYLHTNIGFDRAADTKYEVYWLLPITGIIDELTALSDECKERYDCDIPTMLEFAVRQLTTRPEYKEVGFFNIGDIGTDKEKITNDLGTEKNPSSSHPDWGVVKAEGHANMQAMADNYKVGARVAGEGVKTKAKKLDTMVDKYGGGSQAELEAKLAKMEELEKQGLL